MFHALSTESVATEVSYHTDRIRSDFSNRLRRRRPVNNPAPQGPQRVGPVTVPPRQRVRPAGA